MAYLEPGVALIACEQALRRLVVAVLSKRDGDGWLEKTFKPEQLEKWSVRRDTEQRRREPRGVASVSSRGLDFAELYELTPVIKNNWNRGFAEAWGGVGQSEVLAFLGRLESLRNAVAHSRELLPFERDLLSGIAGYVRNRVTIYLSGQSPIGEHFPRVESVSDNFGHACRDPDRAVECVETEVVLHPGEPVSFNCRGTDPHGRVSFSWFLRTQGERRSEVVVGSDVELQWNVDERDINERRQVEIVMRADSAYHRMGFGQDDAYIVFAYLVLPRKAAG